MILVKTCMLPSFIIFPYQHTLKSFFSVELEKSFLFPSSITHSNKKFWILSLNKKKKIPILFYLLLMDLLKYILIWNLSHRVYENVYKLYSICFQILSLIPDKPSTQAAFLT